MRPSILVVLLLAVPTFAAKPRKVKAPVPEKATPLHGTWTRETPGIRVALKFTENRLFATLQMAKKPEGKGLVETGAIKLDADYGVGPGGRVFGVITGVDFSASDGAFAEFGKDAVALQSALDELLFAFRTRVEADTLTVAGLKADGLKEAGGLLPLLLGKYQRTDGSKLPPIKPVKMWYPLSGSLTLPSPHYLQHFPTYFPPDTPRPTTGAIVGALIGAGSGGLIGRNPATGSQLRVAAHVEHRAASRQVVAVVRRHEHGTGERGRTSHNATRTREAGVGFGHLSPPSCGDGFPEWRNAFPWTPMFWV